MQQLENKTNLGFFPTPVEFLPRISAKYGHNIYIKRDDQTGLASGGNKTRKLEYLAKNALDLGANALITIGGQQSNHCRQTAAAAAKLGLQSYLILRGEKPENFQGNLLLDKILGANLLFVGDKDLFQEIKILAQQLKDKGIVPYQITMGGSDDVGCLGYVNAIQELKNQEDILKLEFDEIYFSTSSGGTQAGMVLGKKIFDLNAKIIGVSNDKSNMDGLPLAEYILKVINSARKNLSFEPEISISEIHISKQYNEAGYGVFTENEQFAITELAQNEGIILDPVYTARAFFGMLDMLKNQQNKHKKNILFWHTGGQSANFSYNTFF